jgi:LPS export ABC transporter protein LptC
MKKWRRFASYAAIIAVVAVAYFLGTMGRGGNGDNTVAALPPDPGYAARDAEIIETGYDGRERYRLNAKVIRQQIDSNVINLEQLAMDYHPGAQGEVPGERPAGDADPSEVWHLRSDRGQVRADGDDVQLEGNVQLTGPAPGSGAPLKLSTATLRVNTPTEFVQTDAPVVLDWSGHQIRAVGFEADLKRGKLRLISDIHGLFSQQ